ncbi:MAG TPA: tRNA pseudouridine(13) synthase TruD, partial [Longimicrobiales bacterium]|nr:tRNA pseudouridine(13) synthase TruD [Longimicrobiales bacterium]
GAHAGHPRRRVTGEGPRLTRDIPGGTPRLTRDIPAVPGTVRLRYEDFRVDEVPAYAPTGEGDHVFFRIEKTGLSTFQAVRDIARHLGVDARAIGSAGLKDARAITTQALSVEHVEPERIRALEIPRIRVLEAVRSRKKLRTGHLRGNRFRIALRPPAAESEAAADRLERTRAVLRELGRRGVPNYFGPQRFGIRGDTGEIGRAVLEERWYDAAALIAGRPDPADPEDLLRARTLFEEGRFADAAAAWPRAFVEAARVCREMERTGRDARRAVLSVGRRMVGFYVSAWQSWLFNRVLATRVDALDRLLAGDLAMKHESGGIFLVESPAAEQPRADAFEISPTGPLFGTRMGEPEGEPRALEERVLAESGMDAERLRGRGRSAPSGSRRALRIPLADAEADLERDDLGEHIVLRFALPAGAYATAVLEEVAKEGLVTATAEDFLEAEGE